MSFTFQRARSWSQEPVSTILYPMNAAPGTFWVWWARFPIIVGWTLLSDAFHTFAEPSRPVLRKAFLVGWSTILLTESRCPIHSVVFSSFPLCISYQAIAPLSVPTKILFSISLKLAYTDSHLDFGASEVAKSELSSLKVLASYAKTLDP